MKHLITTKDFSNQEILELFKDAKSYLDEKERDDLKGKSVTTIFFENSTRTQSSFESAARRLGAKVLKLDVSRSSSSKGETLFDTAANLDAMAPNAIVVRHKNSGVPHALANYTHCPIINGGDGKHAHPTQALLDLFTIMEHFNYNVKDKKIAIVGDIKNSRVAASNLELLPRFGIDISLVGPPHFMPNYPIKQFHKLKDIIDDVDIIMSLRTQTERHNIPTYASLKDYANDFCITKKLIKDKELIILHPGPVHRNIDISDEIMADKRSKVLTQVKNGVAIRMAVLKKLILESKI
ncbi:aspartate carbamoyltransferase catalytic subunit [Campylobacter insulaenigrae]|uniref:aspartate carbamoyltransferase catalytic subunit n=1 Tax=Campylobacter insulaenigrae TaxID=260714 RepID=UPI000F70039F|nr:aspartate carbamoyltransferase catalytic subunit [Campylobacter insulaenigrae]MCR6571206.1 aspartate carbamoyltransferase catalytic subunit [Campylobacter insulaenigrae]MCR6575923.1 aspartate carbamoyltransferase catalytic subunit [Campylobacter insulaenigrae]MCR6578030.1 aspartate carbamoyltransferase catalytic subunit [Campylobacter insulaenigrae]MCR6583580.1 aspartate carbamoyltransferase catalytic subunit [Campylobacter insulaenigrae]MCR6588240.1 aspartate carbamoyltransferase catalytic